jgi:hypothetical protein
MSEDRIRCECGRLLKPESLRQHIQLGRCSKRLRVDSEPVPQPASGIALPPQSTSARSASALGSIVSLQPSEPPRSVSPPTTISELSSHGQQILSVFCSKKSIAEMIRTLIPFDTNGVLRDEIRRTLGSYNPVHELTKYFLIKYCHYILRVDEDSILPLKGFDKGDGAAYCLKPWFERMFRSQRNVDAMMNPREQPFT